MTPLKHFKETGHCLELNSRYQCKCRQCELEWNQDATFDTPWEPFMRGIFNEKYGEQSASMLYRDKSKDVDIFKKFDEFKEAFGKALDKMTESIARTLGQNLRGGSDDHYTMGDAEYLLAFDEVVIPVAEAYKPDIILVSAGFDAAEGDPLGGYKISPAGYAHMTRRLQAIKSAAGRVVVVLEGGYNLTSISNSSAAILRTLQGEAVEPLTLPPPKTSAVETVSALAAIHRLCGLLPSGVGSSQAGPSRASKHAAAAATAPKLNGTSKTPTNKVVMYNGAKVLGKFKSNQTRQNRTSRSSGSTSSSTNNSRSNSSKEPRGRRGSGSGRGERGAEARKGGEAKENGAPAAVAKNQSKAVVQRAFLWQPDEARRYAVAQGGASNCGATAVLNVLSSLKVPSPPIEHVEQAVHTNLRKHGVPLSEYLQARSVAGCTGENIVAGCEEVAGTHVVSKFFAFYPPRKVDLGPWLASWLSQGCSAVATLNLQRMGDADAWHHQMVYGVDSKTGVHMTNPVQVLPFKDILPGLVSPSVLEIRPSDCLDEAPFDVGNVDMLGPRWSELEVPRQLREIQDKRGSGSSIDAKKIQIPAAYKAGFTIFAKQGSAAAKMLMDTPELPLASELEVEEEVAVSPEAASAARGLRVPADRIPAFAELHESMGLKLQRPPAEKHLQDWETKLTEARAEADIRSFLKTNRSDVERGLERAWRQAEASGQSVVRDLTWARRALDSRINFRGVYSPTISLPEVVRLSTDEVLRAAQRPRQRPIRVQRGSWRASVHGKIRQEAYPYTPALGDNGGSEALEAVDMASGEVLGYVLEGDGYIMDICTQPDCMGSGVGAALLAAVGKVTLDAGITTVALDVRR